MVFCFYTKDVTGNRKGVGSAGDTRCNKYNFKCIFVNITFSINVTRSPDAFQQFSYVSLSKLVHWKGNPTHFLSVLFAYGY